MFEVEILLQLASRHEEDQFCHCAPRVDPILSGPDSDDLRYLIGGNMRREVISRPGGESPSRSGWTPYTLSVRMQDKRAVFTVLTNGARGTHRGADQRHAALPPRHRGPARGRRASEPTLASGTPGSASTASCA